MSIQSKIMKLKELVTTFASKPLRFFFGISQLVKNIQGFNYGTAYKESNDVSPTRDINTDAREESNRLLEFFDGRTEGPGIWKWRHYFEIYDKHFNKFVGRKVNVLEIGIFSGGSLDMWKNYFGERCHIHGVDIAEACRAFESERVTVHIGDQEDRKFWAEVKSKIPKIDILIDDGGHGSGQQITTFEEMLPHLSPGGIYVCEDVHNVDNGFNSFCQGLSKCLNSMEYIDPIAGHTSGVQPNDIQAWIKGIYFYPYMVVIEKAGEPIKKMIAPRHGTQWLPIRTT